jgi:hypothetical protein
MKARRGDAPPGALYRKKHSDARGKNGRKKWQERPSRVN